MIKNLPTLFCALFVAILFIQSGLDKVFDWNGNRSFLRTHFSKTFLAGFVPVMLVTITVLELLTGFLAAIGLIYLVETERSVLIFYSAAIGAAAVTALFFGQRIAKDYAGAASLVPYFLLTLVLLYVSRPSGQ